jgi:predicted secreted protein
MSDNEHVLSRRGAVGAVGIGMAAAAAGPVLAQEREPSFAEGLLRLASKPVLMVAITG